jgi:hypothetical protein
VGHALRHRTPHRPHRRSRSPLLRGCGHRGRGRQLAPKPMPRAWSPPCDRCLSPTRHGRYCRRLSPGGTTRCNRFLCQVCRQLHLSYASCAEDGANFVRQPREEGPTPSGRPDGDKDLIVTCQKDGTSTDVDTS